MGQAVSEWLEFDPGDQEVLTRASSGLFESWGLQQLHLQARRMSLMESFEELLCLSTLRGVERYPHQERTALKVMRRFKGRAILGDEVGLGKTIEASLIIKEYLLRGLARRVLVLCPNALVEQWQIELSSKFEVSFTSSQEACFKQAGPAAWSSFERIVASLSYARTPAQRAALEQAGFDLVVVDEAHRLRSRTSASWRLVQDIPKRFVLLLTATPVQNELEELYNLITLLRPGQLGTPAEFRARFVDPENRRKPLQVQRLRELMQDVMVRNTRATVEVKLPPRRARTVRVEPTAQEAAILSEVADLVRREWGGTKHSRAALNTLQLECGSSPAALAPTLEKLGYRELARRSQAAGLGSKTQAVTRILQGLQEPVLVFTRFLATLEALQRHLRERGLKVFAYHGGLRSEQREAQLERFRQEGGVLLLTEVGGEGKNLQFCRHLVNFDLPWNPMRIEQRVGRIHRLGQQQPIEIVNLCLKGSIEDHLLRLLDDKLNMFELVMGELEMVLGPLEEEEDFEAMLGQLSATCANPQALADEMDSLGQRLLASLQGYQSDKALDETLFGQDLEVEE